MAEVGCLKDGCFQNLQVNGTADIRKKAVGNLMTATADGTPFITAEQSGRTIPVSMAGTDHAIVLPTAVVGLNYTFVLTVNTGSVTNNSFISAGPDLVPSQHFWGNIQVQEVAVSSTGGSQSVALATASQNHICFAVDSTLTGGAGGDWIRVECLTPGAWHATGLLQTTGTPDASVTPMFDAAEIGL